MPHAHKTSLILFFALASAPSWAQQKPLLLFQERDDAPARNLTAAEMSLLGDPFFTLVMRENAGVTSLAEIENLLQPDPAQRRVFIVSENIADPAPGQVRRSVIAFSGSNKGELLDTNVMLSVFFDSSAFPDELDAIEAWGWDNHRSRYNYYKLDTSGTPTLALTWKFRGSSDGADVLSRSDRRGTCMMCHINGAPIMKELLLPWNNWHTFSFVASYLDPAAPNAWPAASTPRLRGVVVGGSRRGGLTGAENLEGLIVSAIRQFNRRRINQSLARKDADGDVATTPDGTQTVVEGRRLLRHVFQTTEVNIISARQTSGLHPFPSVTTSGPSQPVDIPNTFFLNANLMAGGTILNYKGLAIQDALSFSSVAKVKPDEYRRLIQDAGVQLGRRKPGDTHFAWFAPEPSHVDNDIADQLLKRGIISPQFLAAAIAVDLETPVLSKERASLLATIPDKWVFKPQAASHPDDLTLKVIAALDAAKPTAGSAAARFLSRLRSNDPVKALEQDTNAYLDRVKKRLNDSASRQQELTRLFQKLIETRRRVLDDPVLGALDETENRLFPLP